MSFEYSAMNNSVAHVLRQNEHRAATEQAVGASLREENLKKKFRHDVPDLQPEIARLGLRLRDPLHRLSVRLLQVEELQPISANTKEIVKYFFFVVSNTKFRTFQRFPCRRPAACTTMSSRSSRCTGRCCTCRTALGRDIRVALTFQTLFLPNFQFPILKNSKS